MVDERETLEISGCKLQAVHRIDRDGSVRRNFYQTYSFGHTYICECKDLSEIKAFKMKLVHIRLSHECAVRDGYLW